MRILLVEDDAALQVSLSEILRGAGYAVEVSGDGIEGLFFGEEYAIDLAIIDLGLPGLSGLNLIRKLRERERQFPILILTARSEWQDKVEGLESGADDYLTKPFSILELQARVKAILRRSELTLANGQEERVEYRSLVIDVMRRSVFIDGQAVDLTAREFDLLLHFARHPGRVFNRGQLLDQVWGYSHTGYEHTVNSHINRLRKKIDCGAEQTQYIETVWGVGYRFRET